MVAGNSLKRLAHCQYRPRLQQSLTLNRTYNATDFFQQAISYLCRDLNGITSRHSYLPQLKKCPNGITAQVIFPSCWDGMEVDSPDHKSHVSTKPFKRKYEMLKQRIGVLSFAWPRRRGLPSVSSEDAAEDHDGNYLCYNTIPRRLQPLGVYLCQRRHYWLRIFCWLLKRLATRCTTDCRRRMQL